MFTEFKKERKSVVFVDGAEGSDIKKGHKDLTWDDVKNILSNSIASADKNVEMFLPVTLKAEHEWVRGNSNMLASTEGTFRNRNNISSVTMLVLDLDEEGALAQAQKKFAGNEYLVYSTFSNTPETPYKYRMVLDLDEPISIEQHEEMYIYAMAGIDGDYSCKNPSRGYYVASHNSNIRTAGEFFENKGSVLSHENIITLGDQYMDKNAQAALEKTEKKRTHEVVEKRHFSGEKIEASYQGNSLSYEGFFKRHERKLDHSMPKGSKGNRHQYAIDVINSEMGIFKENANFNLLVQFLYKSTQERSTVLLSKGNTDKELPEIIGSGIKLMIASSKAEDPEFIKSVSEQIKDGITQSKAAEKSGKWGFIDRVLEKKPLSNSQNSMMSRYYYLQKALNEELQDIVLKGLEGNNLMRAKIAAFNDKFLKPFIKREISSNADCSFTAIGQCMLTTLEKNNIASNPQEKSIIYDKLCDMISKYITENAKDTDITKDDLSFQLKIQAKFQNELLNEVSKENSRNHNNKFTR